MIVVPDHIRGLVFDCDGTIAHTMPLHYQAWVQALGEQGVPFPEEQFYAFGGVPTEKIIELLNQQHGKQMHPRQVAEYKETLFEAKLHEVTPIEPVIAVLRANVGRLPIAVATGGWRAIATKTLTAMGVIDHLDALVCAEDVVHGKPAPDIFLEAARRIGIDPKACMAFEDAVAGIDAARAAGMLVFDVRTLALHAS